MGAIAEIFRTFAPSMWRASRTSRPASQGDRCDPRLPLRRPRLHRLPLHRLRLWPHPLRPPLLRNAIAPSARTTRPVSGAMPNSTASSPGPTSCSPSPCPKSCAPSCEATRDSLRRALSRLFRRAQNPRTRSPLRRLQSDRFHRRLHTWGRLSSTTPTSTTSSPAAGCRPTAPAGSRPGTTSSSP